MKQCCRDNKGRFQRHNFAPEVETKMGFERVCLNCNLELHQSHIDRKISKVRSTFFHGMLMKCVEYKPFHPVNVNGETKWRRWGQLAAS